MLFNSLEFLLFLPIVVIAFYMTPHRFRWFILLSVSYLFYMNWSVKYTVMLLFSTTTTYFGAILVGKTKNVKKRKLYLAGTILVNLLILFVFKYFNFFNDILVNVFNALNLNYTPVKFSLLLPVGISFYTFQVVGYMIDVYRGNISPQKHLGKYALFVSFFPQIAAGPIQRASHLMHQFDEVKKFDFEKLRYGLLVFMWGLFKKIVIADRLAILVNTVYNTPDEYAGFELIFASLLYSIQIYCDFSGYSDMALGSAKIIGFDIINNFRRPYVSMSINDFWKRWHISLTSWFRDYLYIPLGGNRNNQTKNILIVFLVSGLWHGANLTFIMWGLLNGIYLVIGRLIKPFSDRLLRMFKINVETLTYRGFRTLVNFGLVTFGWIFFRANNINDLGLILKNIMNLKFSQIFNIVKLGLDLKNLVFALLSISLLILVEYFQEKQSLSAVLYKEPFITRCAVYLVIIFSIIIFGVYGDNAAANFIYFQF